MAGKNLKVLDARPNPARDYTPSSKSDRANCLPSKTALWLIRFLATGLGIPRPHDVSLHQLSHLLARLGKQPYAFKDICHTKPGHR
jgi:hypothetical protein